MKVLGIMGSPRLRGNTDLLLDEALKGAASRGADVEKIAVDRVKIAPCKEYYACLRDGKCVIRDDMDDVYGKILGADAIIIANPDILLRRQRPDADVHVPLPGALGQEIRPEHGYATKKGRLHRGGGDAGGQALRRAKANGKILLQGH